MAVMLVIIARCLTLRVTERVYLAEVMRSDVAEKLSPTPFLGQNLSGSACVSHCSRVAGNGLGE